MKKIFCFFLLVLFITMSMFSKQNDYFGNMSDIAPNPNISQKETNVNWYKEAVFYHIWVKSFNDSNGDGIGDLNGVKEKLSYLKDLGITAIWLSPIFEPQIKGERMHGYDTVDYYKINSLFGTEDDLKNLLTEAHKLGIKVVFDLVVNNMSYMNAWFIDAKNGGEKREYFIWKKNMTKKEADEWGKALASKSVWNPTDNGYYYSIYHYTMPDLNFESKKLREEVANILIYWLNFGFDGIRVDSARYLFEEGPKVRADSPKTIDFFKKLRKNIMDEYSSKGYSKVMIAEAWSGADTIAKYYGNGNDEFNICFDFTMPSLIKGLVSVGYKINSPFNKFYAHMDEIKAKYPKGAQNGIILNNHDEVMSRPMSAYEGDEKRVILATAFNLLLPGTPFVYYGNELAMADGAMQGDLRLRTALDWSKLQAQEKNSNSILSWYKKLINIKKSNAPLQYGEYKKVESNSAKVVSYTLSADGKSNLCFFNASDTPQHVMIDLETDKISNKIKPLINKFVTPKIEDNKLHISIEPFGFEVFVE